MSLVFTAEQEELRRTLRAFLADTSSSESVRRVMATPDGVDHGTWRRMARELGLQGIAITEEHGGSGFGPSELAVTFEEMGRALLCAPFFGTVALAATVVQESGDKDAATDLLPHIADGSTIAALAFTEDEGEWDPNACALRAERDRGGFVLSGRKNFVIDGAAADLFLVTARTGAGLCLFAVDAEASGLSRRRLSTLDRTRKQVRLELDRTPARLIGDEGAAGSTVARTLDHASTLLAMEQVGCAQACLDMTIDYVKVRTQFGRKIGSFQAVKHRCADMLVAAEAARVAAYQSVWAMGHAPAELPVAAAMAKAVASEAAVYCATEAIQLHGGIGFTWEHDAHLYYRRAHSSALLFGDVTYQRSLLARRLGI